MGCSFLCVFVLQNIRMFGPDSALPNRIVIHVSVIGYHRTYLAYGIAGLKCCVLI